MLRVVILAALCSPAAAAVKATAANAAETAFLEKYATEDGAVVKESGLMRAHRAASTARMRRRRSAIAWSRRRRSGRKTLSRDFRGRAGARAAAEGAAPRWRRGSAALDRGPAIFLGRRPEFVRARRYKVAAGVFASVPFQGDAGGGTERLADGCGSSALLGRRFGGAWAGSRERRF